VTAPFGPDDAVDPDDDPGIAFEQYDDDDLEVPLDRTFGVDRFGTTAEEQLEGESLDERLSEELPENRDDPEDDDSPAEEAAVEVEDEDDALAPIEPSSEF
jgi:hypothetical protein